MSKRRRNYQALAGLAAAAIVVPILTVGETRLQPASSATTVDKPVIPDEAALIASYGISAELARLVHGDLDFRSQVGFSVSADLAVHLRQNPDLASKSVPELPLTEGEAKTFYLLTSLAADSQAIDQALTASASNAEYGGQYLDPAAGRLIVQVTASGKEAVEELLRGSLASRLANPDRIDVRFAAMSRRDLLTARETLLSRFDSRLKTLVTGVDINEKQNALDVFVDPSLAGDDRKKLESLLADVGVPSNVVAKPAMTPAAGTFTNDSQTPPYAGGHGYVATNSTTAPPPPGVRGNVCTFGFKVYWNSNPSNSFMLSAGHCWYDFANNTWTAPVDSKAYFNWYSTNGGRTAVGSMKGFSATANYDFSLVQMTSSTNPKIVVNTYPGDLWRTVNAVVTYAPQGAPICAVGAWGGGVGGNHCGTVSAWDGSGHQISAQISGIQPGDSGGPLYLPQPDNRAWAAGIMREVYGSDTHSSNISAYLTSFCSCGVSLG